MQVQVDDGRMYLRVKAVAGMLDVSVATIYRAIESGALPALKVGSGKGALRVPIEAVREYMRTCETPTWAPRTVGSPLSSAAADLAPASVGRFAATPNMSTSGSALTTPRPTSTPDTPPAAVPGPSGPAVAQRPETTARDAGQDVSRDVPTAPAETSHPTGTDRPAGRPAERPTRAPAGRADARPARAGGSSRTRSRRPAVQLSDEALAAAVREMTERNGGHPPTPYQVKTAHNVGHARASRVLADLHPEPAATPAANGAATRKDGDR